MKDLCLQEVEHVTFQNDFSPVSFFTFIFSSPLLPLHPSLPLPLIPCYMQSNPIHDWALKYRSPGKPLPLKKIAQFGRQILEVMSERRKQKRRRWIRRRRKKLRRRCEHRMRACRCNNKQNFGMRMSWQSIFSHHPSRRHLHNRHLVAPPPRVCCTCG